eukprot:146911-Amphidinium_carterae.1
MCIRDSANSCACAPPERCDMAEPQAYSSNIIYTYFYRSGLTIECQPGSTQRWLQDTSILVRPSTEQIVQSKIIASVATMTMVCFDGWRQDTMAFDQYNKSSKPAHSKTKLSAVWNLICRLFRLLGLLPSSFYCMNGLDGFLAFDTKIAY